MEFRYAEIPVFPPISHFHGRMIMSVFSISAQSRTLIVSSSSAVFPLEVMRITRGGRILVPVLGYLTLTLRIGAGGSSSSLEFRYLTFQPADSMVLASSGSRKTTKSRTPPSRLKRVGAPSKLRK